MSLLLACGAECKIVTAGSASAANRHWIVAGTPALETTIVHSGACSYKFVAAGTAPTFQRNFAASQTVAYFRGYFYFTSVTPSADTALVRVSVTTGSNAVIHLMTTGVLRASFAGSGAQTSQALSINTWYGVEFQAAVGSDPHTIDWRVWEAGTGWANKTSASDTAAADTFTTTGCTIGVVSGPTSGITVYIDDILIGSGTTVGEDYDTGASKGGKVLRYLPDADLTHSFTTNDFEYNDTTGIASSATDIYTYLDDDDQSSIADFISQNVAWSSGTKAFQVAFADESTETQPRAVGIVSTHHSSGTAANEMNVRVSDDGSNWTNVWGDWAGAGVDVSATTGHFHYKILNTKPSGGAWTVAAVNAMRAQMGQSNDVSAVPYYDSISLEVEWTEAGSTTYSGSFTADSNLKKIDISQSVTADSNLRKNDISSSFTSDAYIFKVFEASFTSDSYIQKLDIPGSFTADSNIQKLDIGDSLTSDSNIQKLDISSSFTADSEIAAGVTTYEQSFTSDAYILKVQSDSLTSDSHISKNDISASVVADANIKFLDAPGSFTTDSHINRNDIEASLTADSNISKNDITQSFTADSYILKEQGFAFTADAQLTKTISDSITADAAIFATVAQSFTADSNIYKTDIPGSFIADSHITNLVSSSITADAYVKKVDVSDAVTSDSHITSLGIEASFISDAYIQRTFSADLTADSNIQKLDVPGSFVADSYVFKQFSASITADAYIVVVQPGSFTADAEIEESQATTYEGSFTANSHLASTVTSSLTSDAHIAGTVVSSITADAYTIRVFEFSITADAFVLKTTSESVLADAYILQTFIDSFVADSHVASNVQQQFVADSYVLRVIDSSITVDGYILVTQSDTFVADAFINKIVSDSIVSDAHIASTVYGQVTADAYIIKTLSGSFTADSEFVAPIGVIGATAAIGPGNPYANIAHVAGPSAVVTIIGPPGATLT